MQGDQNGFERAWQRPRQQAAVDAAIRLTCQHQTVDVVGTCVGIARLSRLKMSAVSAIAWQTARPIQAAFEGPPLDPRDAAHHEEKR